MALPLSAVFNNTLSAPIDAAAVNTAAAAYVSLLEDLDTLVGTDSAFQVGGWLEQAKQLAAAQPGQDCIAKGFPEITDCTHFYEW